MPRRNEEELMEMIRRQGGAPSAGGPMDVGGPMPSPEMPMGQQPPGPMPEGPMAEPPMPGGPMSPEELQGMPGTEMQAELPTMATVLTIEGEEVTLEADTGEMITLPLAAFPIEPVEGMTLEAAEVVMLQNGTLIANVGPNNVEVELETDMLQMPFNVGDMFWMPSSPASVEETLGETVGEEIDILEEEI